MFDAKSLALRVLQKNLLIVEDRFLVLCTKTKMFAQWFANIAIVTCIHIVPSK